jgi:hypothetical protein
MKLDTRKLQPPLHDPVHRVERGRRTVALVAVLSLLIVSIVALVVMVLRQDGMLQDRETEIATLRTQVVSIRSQGAGTREELVRMTAVNARLRDRIAATSDELRGELAAMRQRYDAMVGPALPDGRHFGRLIAVGADQTPPRLIIDIQQWFTDEAADQAAAEDGMLTPGQAHIENGYYIRNENPRWRVVEVVPASTVAIVTYPYGQIDEPMIVGFERFSHMFARNANWIASSPYWITVRDQRVTAIEQQFIP